MFGSACTHGSHVQEFLYPERTFLRRPSAADARLWHAPSTESMSLRPSESPGSAARSPLMITPQVPMVPIPKADELRLGVRLGGYAPAQRMQQAYYEPSLYGDFEKGVATMIAWGHGGAHVGVIGSWDNWQTR